MHRRIPPLFRHPWGWASLAPLLCAVHCAATPLVVVVAPTIAPGERAEWILLALTVVLAFGAFVGARRAHRELTPFVAVAAGLIAWTGSLLHLYHPVPETITTVASSLMVATGLLWNSRLHCAARAVPCDACRDELRSKAPTAGTPTAAPRADAEAAMRAR